MILAVLCQFCMSRAFHQGPKYLQPCFACLIRKNNYHAHYPRTPRKLPSNEAHVSFTWNRQWARSLTLTLTFSGFGKKDNPVKIEQKKQSSQKNNSPSYGVNCEGNIKRFVPYRGDENWTLRNSDKRVAFNPRTVSVDRVVILWISHSFFLLYPPTSPQQPRGTLARDTPDLQ